MTVNKLSLPAKENAVQQKINEIIDNLGGGVTIDQTFDPTSVNAQSGVAIAGAGFVTGTVKTIQDVNSLSNGTINLSMTESFYKFTPSAATTFTFSTSNLTLSSSVAYTFELCVVMSTAYTLTFPSTVKWQDGTTPTMTNTGTYFFAFRTIDSGTTWKGSLQGVWQ